MRRSGPHSSSVERRMSQQEGSTDAAAAASSEVAATASSHQNGNGPATPGKEKIHGGGPGGILRKIFAFGGIRFLVLMILCFQNSMFTVLRRYSLGVLKEEYSKVRGRVAA